jgi:hypothetical protein
MAVAADDAARAASDLGDSQDDSEFEAKLLEVLKGIQTSGSFAASQALPSMPIGISVDGVGDITMPLDETQARQLIAKARQAPYGKGSQTLVDTSVRNTWELDPGQFTFTNPAWDGYFRDMCAKVALQMGIEATVRADIYKMLIYEKGAMFKAHTESVPLQASFSVLANAEQ